MTIIGHATKQANAGRGLPLDEIKDKLDIMTVATSRLGYTLKRRGNKHQGDHGQVHSSKNAQCLTIYNGQNWHCFHCNRGGDVLNLIGVHEFGENYSGRGQDFRKTIELAAGWAGVEIPQATPEEQTKSEERERLFNLMTAAAHWWHEQLVEEYPEILDWITTNYGFTEDFIERKLIGFAPPQDKHKLLLKYLIKLGYSEEECKAASVINKGGYGRFRGRVTFPYFQNGQVRYFAARQTSLTPDDEHERAKYQKLKVRDDDNPHISEHIKNDVLLGMDTLKLARKQGRVLITEGAPDQLAAEQIGEASLSPVTVRFKASDIPRIAELVKEIGRTYLCMDNEESQAGQLGALDTARALEERGVPIWIIRLPRPEDLEKIDVCDFIKSRGKEAFLSLYQEAVRVPLYLARFVPPENSDTDSYIREIARLAKACKFSAIDQDELIRELATRLKIKTTLVKQVFTEVFSHKTKDVIGSDYEVEVPGLEIERLEKITSDPPVYEFQLKGAKRTVKFTTEELLDFATFRNKVFAATNIAILHPIPPDKTIGKPDTWTLAVKTFSKVMVEVEAPADADANYLIKQKIKEFLTNSQYHSEDKRAISELGRVWIDEKTNIYWFRGAESIQRFLKAYLEIPPSAPELWSSFKELGGISKTLRLGDRPAHCWGLHIGPEKMEEPAE
jgi:DNA primase